MLRKCTMFILRELFLQGKNSMLMLTQKALQIYGDLGTARLLPMISTMHLLKPKSICTTSLDRASTIEVIRPIRPIERMLKKIGILDVQKYRYMALGNLVYEHVMAQVDYPFFYKHFNMADTFFSWFLVTELHLWMIMVRYMAEGNAGRLVRNSVVNTLWEDTKARAINLGNISEKLRNKQIQELSQQFNAAIIGYDEGIQSNDKVLAAALWRRFFHLECNNPEHVESLIIYVRKQTLTDSFIWNAINPEHVESLIIYVRKQISLFDNLPSHQILRKPVLKLIDIEDICKPQ